MQGDFLGERGAFVEQVSPIVAGGLGSRSRNFNLEMQVRHDVDNHIDLSHL